MPNRRHRNQVTPKVMKVSRVKRSSGTPEKGEGKPETITQKNRDKNLKKPYPGLRVKRSSGSPKGGETMKKKYKGFSKLPERVQRKIDPKLARQV